MRKYRFRKFFLGGAVLTAVLLLARPGACQAVDKEPVTISVVVTNPSKDKDRTIPVKIDLPQEVKPEDVLEKSELELLYDDERSIYFLFSPEVQLKPQETRVFNVMVRNVWMIPEEKIREINAYTDLVLGRLKGSEYYEQGQKIANLIHEKLDNILSKQKDETIGQKQRIGTYRLNLKAMEEVRKDLEQIEKLLTFQGGTPVPQMLQEADIKSDAPSTKTTWLIIFSIVIFLGLLGAQFFFTWSRRAAAERAQDESRKKDLPGSRTPGS